MKKLFAAVSMVVLALVLLPTSAPAQSGLEAIPALASFGSSASPALTTTGLTTLGTTGALVYFITLKKDDKRFEEPDAGNVSASLSQAEAEQVAELYLKGKSVQLSQDLSLGHGAALAELASFFEVSSPNQAAFARVLKDNRQELLSLSRAETLSPARAGVFFRRISALMEQDQRLAEDLAAARARHS